jgi:hypothetical protein
MAVKKVKCIKCKEGTVAYFDGKLLTLQRLKQSFAVHGDAWNILATCPRCGSQNNVSMTKNDQGVSELDTACPTEEIDYTKMTEEKNNNNEVENKEVKNEQQADNKQEDGNSGGSANNSGGDGAGSGASQ